MLYNLHFLRVIAALAVVYYHTTSEAGLNLSVNIGSRGVDVFFVISGFIIAHIGKGSAPVSFIVRRLIRIVPFYWAATLFVFSVAFAFPSLLRSTAADVTHLAYSLAFVPHFSARSDGFFPTLILGWSLNFEMYFYALFAVSLALSRSYAPLLCCAGIGSVVAFAALSGIDSPVLQFYGRPIALEFAFGVLAFYCFRWLSKFAPTLERKLSLKWLLIAGFITSLLVICFFEAGQPNYPRYLVAGVPAFFAVLCAVLLERIFGVFTTNRTIHLLGESSYIIYLIHPYIIYSVLRVFVKNHDLTPSAILALILGLLALASAFSVAMHVWFERPLMRALRHKLLPTARADRV